MNNKSNKYINRIILAKLSTTGISLLHVAAYPSFPLHTDVRLSSNEVYLFFWTVIQPNINLNKHLDNTLSIYNNIIASRELDRFEQIINKVNKVE